MKKTKLKKNVAAGECMCPKIIVSSYAFIET